MHLMPLSKRIQEIIDAGHSKASLARAAGVTAPSVTHWLTGASKEIKGPCAAGIQSATGYSAAWIASGKLPKMAIAMAKNQDADLADELEIVIPQYDVAGAMGNGGLVLEEKQPGVIKKWHVDHEWLRLNVKNHTGTKNLCIVTGFGPSMRPLYNPGDPLLLDSGVNAVDSEGVFFFRIGDHGYIKQLQRIPVGRETVIRAKSLNPSYDPFDITKEMDFQVFGKVLTIWKSEQV